MFRALFLISGLKILDIIEAITFKSNMNVQVFKKLVFEKYLRTYFKPNHII